MERHARVKTELMKIPGVVDVAVGLKEKDGMLTDEITFQVFVEEKKEEKDLMPEHIIPKQVMGFKTDVQKVPRAIKREDSSEYRPIKGGVQVGNGKGHVGTLGCFGRLTSDNARVLLTNQHVLFKDGAVAGDLFGQPDIDHNCCCCCAYIDGKIGTILNPGIDNERVDCGLAKINDDVATDIILNNSMTATEIPIAGTQNNITAGDTVRKIGRTSGLTTGTISSINGPTTSKTNQIHIRPVSSETYTLAENGKKAFSDRGDSGSVVVNEDNEIIGLLWGGDPALDPNVDVTFACHIGVVLTELNNAGIGINIETTPPGRPAVKVKKTGAPKRMDTDIREKMLQSGRGTILVQLFEKHQKEIRNLINHNRKVIVTWQRHQGPAFLAHLLKNIREENHNIPAAVGEIPLQELLIKMSAALKETGTVALQKDVEQYALDIIQHTYGVHSFAAYLDKIGEEAFV